MGRTVSCLLNLSCGDLSMPFQSIQSFIHLFPYPFPEKKEGSIEVLTRHSRAANPSFRQTKKRKEKNRKTRPFQFISLTNRASSLSPRTPPPAPPGTPPAPR